MALSDRIVADGGTPWCFGFESGVATGWPGTDFLESLVLRVGGVEVYDEWTRGEIGFTSPAVMKAGRLADAVFFKPGYVRGGATSISKESWDNELNHMLFRDSTTGETEPQCWLLHQAGYMLKFAPANDKFGTDVDAFVLPPIDPSQTPPVIGTASFVSALTDRPEVREFMEFLASPEWGSEHWAAEPGNDFMSPNQRFDPSNYGDASDPAVGVHRRLADATLSALQSGTFRMDASDLMPVEIGGFTLEGGPGPFYRGMDDWVDGTRSIEQVFSDIDDAWAAIDESVRDRRSR
jgi:alpha-glucoside transport system substrate-binding protein